MSVERDIKIRILTNECFTNLLERFVDKDWCSNNKTIDVEDTDDFDFIETEDFQELKSILTQRESRGLSNYVILTVFDFESVILSVTKLDHNYQDFKYQYELHFNLGIGKRIKNADRYTDFGFYLEGLLPKLINLGCHINEVNCKDFDS